MAASPWGCRRRGGDDAKATEHQLANHYVKEVEGIKRNSSTGLIEGWLGMELALVRGPSATPTAEMEQSSAIPQLKRGEGSRGGSEVLGHEGARKEAL